MEALQTMIMITGGYVTVAIALLGLVPVGLQLWLMLIAPIAPRATFWLIRLPYWGTAAIRSVADSKPAARTAQLAAWI
jgi:hypothetical protein